MAEEGQKEEKLIGKITHFFNKIGVAVIELTEGDLKTGEKIHIKGGDHDFEQEVSSMQIEHQEIKEAKKGDSFGMKVNEPAKEGYAVYKILE